LCLLVTERICHMSNPTNHIEIITSVQRRRSWTASEKVRMVEETFEPGMTVSLVARAEPVVHAAPIGGAGQPDCGRQWRGGCPASDYRALQNQVRELHRLLGKKTLEAEILKEALATGSKKRLRLRPKDDSR
jgi:transposase